MRNHMESKTNVSFITYSAFSDWLAAQPLPQPGDTNPKFPHPHGRKVVTSDLGYAYRLRAKFLSWAEVELGNDGALRWRSNNKVIPPHVLEDAFVPVWPDQERVYRIKTEEELKAYKANQKPATAEELYEMRAAFGEGETVVDVLTGRQTKL